MALVPVVFGLAGLLFATSAGAARGTDLRGDTRSDLADLISAQQHDLARQAQAVGDLRTRVDKLSDSAATRDGGVARVREAARGAETAAQLTAVVGPSLTVTLNDAPPTDPASLGPDIGPDDLVVHQQDLQAVVNAMWAGGADSMRLMDQRVISTSAVRCVGNVLLLQGRQYPPPYRVTAIGDVAGMRAALAGSEYLQAYRYVADRVGLGWDVRSAARTTLPAYQGALTLTSATVLTAATATSSPTAASSPTALTQETR